jgi:Zn-dependent protease with chaperone function
VRDMQRAEYLADALAARVAGTDAEISSDEKLLLAPLVLAAVSRVAHALPGERVDAFDELAAAVARVPERERERLRRVARLEETRLDATHPPTAKRIELLERRGRVDGLVILDAQRSAAIDDELRGRRRALQEQLVDDFRDALYES